MPRYLFPQWNPFRDYVRKELARRKSRPPFSSRNEVAPQYTPVIAPFVRFTSCLQDQNGFDYKFFSLGLHGAREANNADIFELSYGQQDVVGFAYSTDKQSSSKVQTTRNSRKPITANQQKSFNKGLDKVSIGSKRHPPPGVTHVAVNLRNLWDYIEITVTWKCYNAVQLEFLRPHFIQIGHYAVVEIGHRYSDQFPVPTFDFGTSDAASRLAEMVVKGRRYINDTVVAAANGNYDIFIGKIISAEISQLSDGTFEVTTTLASVGEALEYINNTRNQAGDDVSTTDTRYDVPTTIHDYFDGPSLLGYDRLLKEAINAHKKNQIVYAGAPGVVTKVGRAIVGKAQQWQHPEEIFISWDFFIREVMRDLMSRFKGENVSNDIYHFSTINQSIDNDADVEPLVGNNPFLLSTKPEVMLIVKKEIQDRLKKAGKEDLFRDALPFENKDPQSNTPDQYVGKLSQGVWLNAEFVRQSFLQSKTIFDAFRTILRGMNAAVGGFWKLEIIWDEFSHRIIIFDANLVAPDLTRSRKEVYHFNQGGNPSIDGGLPRGELLGLQFQGSYTSEASAAALLTSLSNVKDKSKGGHSGINGPDRHSTLLNALIAEDGEYQDILDLQVNALKAGLKTVGEVISEDPAKNEDAKSRTTPPTDPIPPEEISPEEKEAKTALEKSLQKFEDVIGPYFDIESSIQRKIRDDGIKNPGVPNGFIAPVPTNLTLNLTIQGIGGIELYDAFLVDHLPRVYERHGMFLVQTLQHEVTVERGWITTFGGIYYFMHADPVPIQTSQEAATQHELLAPRPTADSPNQFGGVGSTF